MDIQLLELDEVLGYYISGDVAIRLTDGRYALIYTQRENAPPRIGRGFVTVFVMSVLRNQVIIDDIPEELIEKTKRILADINSYIKCRDWNSDPLYVDPTTFLNSKIEKINIAYLNNFRKYKNK
ncbi:hypothetical protein [Peptoniphilus duerdenii]|uniref:hypothetical protein n=1 Tax=Peptoniphilus duerdenii TaxID=507750 RepID=UPI0028893941|nr:hypothetical protein [Peptoniphilus duerdenii]